MVVTTGQLTPKIFADGAVSASLPKAPGDRLIKRFARNSTLMKAEWTHRRTLSAWNIDFSFGFGRAVRRISKYPSSVPPTNFSLLNV